MNALLSRLVLVGGVCLSAVGAAGFGEPVENLAWPLFGVGVVATLIGGIALRREVRCRAAAGAEGGLSLEGLAAALAELAGKVAQLDEQRESLEREALCGRIDELLAGPYFEIGSHNEDYARALGPATFARIWEGFAGSERLLSRTWSIATDGHLAEALEELPRARAQITRAAEQAGATQPG